MNYSTQILRSFDPMVPEWWELFHRSPNATPFQSPAWLVPWWKSFGFGESIIVAVREHARLCGLGIFYLYDQDLSAGRQLFFVGKGVSDYLDVLIEDSANPRRDEITEQVFHALFDYAEPSLRWTSADFDRLPPNSPVLNITTDFAASVNQEGLCPELPLNGSTLTQIVKKSTRDQLRKHFNRARNMGDLEFVTAGQSNLHVLFNELIRLDHSSWSAKSKPGIFADQRMLRFMSNAAQELQRARMLRLNAMLLNGEAIAASFAMLHGERLYFYLCDFDPAFAAISPGTMLTAHVIEQAAQAGAKFFDFLQGDEPYKFAKWGAQPRPTYRLRMIAEPARAAA